MSDTIKRTRIRVILKAEDIDYLIGNLPESMEDLGNNRIASYLTNEQYETQMCSPDTLWYCPITRKYGSFDDEWYESNNMK